jgi:hypothetical protein
VRCHRGPKPRDNDRPQVIECCFSWKVADSVFKALGRGQQDGVMVCQKFSRATMERRNQALIKRKELKQGGRREWKLYVRYPATLLAKKPGENMYSVIEKF